MTIESTRLTSEDDAAKAHLLKLLNEGISAITIDYLWAAKSLGLEHWAFEELKREFNSSNAETAQWYLNSTLQNAKRSTIEMTQLNEFLAEVGYQSTMTHGTMATLSQIMHSKPIPFAKLTN
jgi:uncharacterized protein YaiI (UPF0178 family)